MGLRLSSLIRLDMGEVLEIVMSVMAAASDGRITSDEILDILDEVDDLADVPALSDAFEDILYRDADELAMELADTQARLQGAVDAGKVRKARRLERKIARIEAKIVEA